MYVIGKQGQQIKQIQSDTNAVLQASPKVFENPPPERTITTSGE